MKSTPQKTAIRGLSEVLLLYACWTIATYVLEGSRQTLLRPDAIALRTGYAVVANMIVGVAVGILLLGRLQRTGILSPRTAGFGSYRRSLVWVPVGFILGFLLYAVQGAPTWDPNILVNAFAQVLVVSAAEVVVCWAVIATVLKVVVRSRSPKRRMRHSAFASNGSAIVGAAILFGLYHFAHSPPFNTISMVFLLMGVGVVSGTFFLISRDIYGTLVFHNLFGVFGVLSALAAHDALAGLRELQWPLIAMAAATMLLFLIGHLWLWRRASQDRLNHHEEASRAPA